MSALNLLRDRRAKTNYNYAQRQQKQATPKPQVVQGRVAGRSSETGMVLVATSDGGTVQARTITNGFHNGDIVTAIVPPNSNFGFVDGMPGWGRR